MSDMTRHDAVKQIAAGVETGSAGGAESVNGLPGGDYFILACDGGGIRGYLTALILDALQAKFSFLDQVDLFAGTSTGAIIALGLASGKTASDAVGLFRDNGGKIFGPGASKKSSGGWFGYLTSIFQSAEQKLLGKLGVELGELFHAKHPNSGLKDVLGQVFGVTTTFEDLKQKHRSALVTTFRLECESGWAPLVLHNLGQQTSRFRTRVQDGPSLNIKLVDAAMASAAAPLYFPPYLVPGYGYCVDGGLFANCPSAIAYALVMALVPESRRKRLRMLSIGTGASIDRMRIPTPPLESPDQYGAAAWLSPVPIDINKDGSNETPAFPLISALFDASSAAQNYICEATSGIDYHRVQIPLEKLLPMDDASQDNMDAIKAAADKWIANELPATLNWLARSTRSVSTPNPG